MGKSEINFIYIYTYITLYNRHHIKGPNETSLFALFYHQHSPFVCCLQYKQELSFRRSSNNKGQAMGKKLDALLGRSFKASKLKALVNLANSRLTVLKNKRQARLSIAQSDVVQLLNLGHHERALLRVEQVIKEQNMYDVFVMIEGYCFLLTERINLIEQEKVCPDELKEAVSSLLFATTRCGEFPELQEMRAVFTSRFGKEFVGRAIELRNNCGVNAKIVQKLSTRQPALENRMKTLKEIASENGIVLQIGELSSVSAEEKLDIEQKLNQSKLGPSVNSGGAELGNNLQILSDQIEKVGSFTDTMMARKKYRDVADAAQEAFESAAYAAAAARAAVELSRSESHDADYQNSPGPQWKRVPDEKIEDSTVGLGFENINPIQNCQSESEDESKPWGKSVAEFNRSVSTSSSDAENILKGNTMSSSVVDKTKPLGKDIVFEESDDATGNEYSGIPLPRTHGLDLGMKPIAFTNAVLGSEKSNTVRGEDLSEGSGGRLYHPSHKQFPLKTQAGQKVVSEPGNSKAHLAEESKMYRAQRSNTENRPFSVRTRRGYGR